MIFNIVRKNQDFLVRFLELSYVDISSGPHSPSHTLIYSIDTQTLHSCTVLRVQHREMNHSSTSATLLKQKKPQQCQGGAGSVYYCFGEVHI